MSVDADAWRAELPLIEEHYEQFGDRLPPALHDELDALAKRLAEVAAHEAHPEARWDCSAGSSSASSPARSPAPVTGGGWNLGCLGTIVVGVLGGLIGGALFNAAGDEGIGDFGLRSMFVAFVGAVVLLAHRRPADRPRQPTRRR